MITSTPEPRAAFAGWSRPNKRVPWTRLVDGPTYDAAWAALLDATAGMRGGESLVVRADVNPNAPAPRRYTAGGKRLL
jgi:hypothetical protein